MKNLTLSVLAVCVLYAAFAFFSLSFNPSDWFEMARALFSYLAVVALFIGLGTTVDNDKNQEGRK